MNMLRLEFVPGTVATTQWSRLTSGAWGSGNVEVRRETVNFADRWFVWVSHDGAEHSKYHAPRNSNGYSTDDVAKNAAFLMSVSHRCR